MEIKPEPCPFCGNEVKISGGPENWKPTFYDPDSGGDPYTINCECGCSFGFFDDAEELIERWNTRIADKSNDDVDLENKCGGCFYAKPTIAFGKSKCYIECTNKEHVERYCKRQNSSIRARTQPACKSYQSKKEINYV